MTIKNKISCIVSKILGICIILSSILFTPFHFYNGVEFTFINLLILILISSAFFFIGFFQILKTNDPITRYNLFTINKYWESTMKSSVSEDPSVFFSLDDPSKNDIVKSNRNKKIKELLK